VTVGSQIRVPALRARMGDWVYYTSVMKLRDVAARISSAKETHIDTALVELLQRQLTDRSKSIKEYLLTQPQRLFNSIVAGVFGGTPQWQEIDLNFREDQKSESLESMAGVFGVLTLDLNTKIFAIDGQHRVVGIVEALKSNPSLGAEEISVIFVTGVASSNRKDDERGYERTRRLFTTLNKYAKPVSIKDIIALDEDDVTAIITRRILDDYIPLQGKVAIGQGKNIRSTDLESLTSIESLYQVLDIFLKSAVRSATWKKSKTRRPDEAIVASLYEEATSFWDALRSAFDPIEQLALSKPREKIAANYRNKDGGHLLFRPIGLEAVVKTVRRLMDTEHLSLGDAMSAVASVPMTLNSFPWDGLLWHDDRMVTDPKHKSIAERVLLYLAGGNLGLIKTGNSKKPLTLEDLIREYAGATKIDAQVVRVGFNSIRVT
jgi:DNA sulfur modification protein DndB